MVGNGVPEPLRPAGWWAEPSEWRRSPITLPETNIAPENRPLEKEIPIGNHHFQGRAVSFRECKIPGSKINSTMCFFLMVRLVIIIFVCRGVNIPSSRHHGFFLENGCISNMIVSFHFE